MDGLTFADTTLCRFLFGVKAESSRKEPESQLPTKECKLTFSLERAPVHMAPGARNRLAVARVGETVDVEANRSKKGPVGYVWTSFLHGNAF